VKVLGNEAYESFARAGLNMTNSGMATYALDQIDRLRREFERPAHSMGNTTERR
jgi:hypothetical protein